jgi:TolA-binding protein
MRSLILIITLGVCGGCAIKRYIETKSNQIDEIEGNTQKIEKKLSKIDSLLKKEEENLTSIRAETRIKMEELNEKLGSVENRLREIEELIYKRKGEKGGKDTLKRRRDIYNIAYSDFLKGNYELAISGFKQYLAEFEEIDDAYYFLGECYYALKEYTKAEEVFKNISTHYPMSEKAPAAIYKLISIYNIQKDSLNKEMYLKKLLEIYPKSPEAKLMKEEKKKKK